MEYLSKYDPSLHEAMDAAEEYGYSPKDLSSEILATLVNERHMRQAYWDWRDGLQDILDQIDDPDDDEEIEGVGLVSHLIPSGSQKSFGGKAIIEDNNDGWLVLYSYDTPVAQYDKQANLFYILPNDKYAPNKKYSATTTKHIRAFADQLGVNVGKATVGVY